MPVCAFRLENPRQNPVKDFTYSTSRDIDPLPKAATISDVPWISGAVDFIEGVNQGALLRRLKCNV